MNSAPSSFLEMGEAVCVPSTSSLAPEAASSPTSSSATRPKQRSKSTRIVATSSGREIATDGFQEACGLSRPTSAESIPPTGKDEWIASMRASLARTSAWLEEVKASPDHAAAYGARSSVSLMFYDHSSSSWKTHQQSLLGGLIEYSETWPSWGMMRDGQCCPLPPLVPHTFGRAGGAGHGSLIPTPTKTDARGRDRYGNGTISLLGYAKLWPTPTRRDWKSTSPGNQGNARPLSEAVGEAERGLYPTPTCADAKQAGGGSNARKNPNFIGGQLNPAWVEWLMGWPIGWTESKPLETDRCPCVPPLPGNYLGE
jgi:hypothetical protein